MKYLCPLYFFFFCNALNAAQDVQKQVASFNFALRNKNECNPESDLTFPTFTAIFTEASTNKSSAKNHLFALSLIYDKDNKYISINNITNGECLDKIPISPDEFEKIFDLKYHNKKSIQDCLMPGNGIYFVNRDYYLVVNYTTPQCHAIAHINQIEFKKNDKLPEQKKVTIPISSPEGSRMSSPELFFRVALSAAIIAGFFYSCYFLGNDLIPTMAKKLCGK